MLNMAYIQDKILIIYYSFWETHCFQMDQNAQNRLTLNCRYLTKQILNFK